MSESLLLKLLSILSGAIIIGCSSQTLMQEPRLNTQERAVKVLLSKWDNADEPGVAIAVSLDGKLEYSLGLGLANLEYEVPITLQTPFHSASLSKQFTAFSVLLLENEGLLSLDDDVRKHLPKLANFEHTITIRHLLHHTSGLRDAWTLAGAAGWRIDDPITDQHIKRLAYQQTGLNFVPGSKYEYNNLGYFLLAQIVEKVSEQTLSIFTQSRIFEPIGMTNTHFHDDNAKIVSGRAYSYYPESENFIKGNLNYGVVGPTGLFTTVEDLTKWAQNFESPLADTKGAVTAMKEQGILSSGTKLIYAMGQETRAYKGLTTWSHGGRDAGYRSFLLRIPSQKFSVSILSNTSQFDTAKVAYNIADIYLKDKPEYVEKVVSELQYPTEKQLKEFAGNYEVFPGLIFSITSDAEKLYFSNLGSPETMELKSLSSTEFILNPNRDISLIFVEENTGTVKSLKYKIGMHGELDAPRVELAPFDKNTLDLNEYTGRYYSKELNTEYMFAIVDGELVAQHTRLSDIPMTAYQDDVFSTPKWQFEKIAFIRDNNDHIIGCHVSGAVAERILFEKTMH